MAPPADTGPTGLDQLRASLLGGGSPISRFMGMEVDELAEGRVVFSLTPQPTMVNPIGLVHGGIAATLLDSAMGCAVHSALPAGVRYSTIDLHVHYVRPVPLDAGAVVATGTVVHVGGRMATAEGSLRDGAGTLLAHGTTTCLVMR